MAADSRPCLGDARAWSRPKQEQTVELGNRRTFHADARRNQATTGFGRTANSRKSPSSRSRSGGRKRPHAPRRASGRVGLSRHSWPFCPYLSPNSHVSTRDAFSQFAWVHGQRTTDRRQRHTRVGVSRWRWEEKVESEGGGGEWMLELEVQGGGGEWMLELEVQGGGGEWKS